ncbi:DUF2291 family protein [Brytella acorum]|uniref:DUF2291 family protein n=1 Tax=Brytella acorum TaxID=2959299 RepID=A0AA35UXK1_9PROT|nr:DUF2291 family protein [Brytella acorum]MDF3625695.1 DUF2291 family protein [Brytella acorum]CAI9121324.1 DUF2291 family protein [Brytella acorum]
MNATDMMHGSTNRGFSKGKRRGLIYGLLGAVLVCAMAVDTHVVRLGKQSAAEDQEFSAATYGPKEFPKMQAAIAARAVEATILATALKADADAAARKYGVQGSVGPEISVKFTGTVGDGKRGIYTVNVPGMPEDIHIRMQTGPAINGTDLRDATGDIVFGQFRNQIDFQNAGAALNTEMKKHVLAPIDTANLTGKTVIVTGVFQLINPANWLVTPSEMKLP